MKQDKYDKQIKLLTKHPELIGNSWASAEGLFQGASPTGTDINYGCLTMVKSGGLEAYTISLTERIRSDPRIPSSQTEITPELLPVFAEYQREMDEMWGESRLG